MYCRCCGLVAVHATADECIDALRKALAKESRPAPKATPLPNDAIREAARLRKNANNRRWQHAHRPRRKPKMTEDERRAAKRAYDKRYKARLALERMAGKMNP